MTAMEINLDNNVDLRNNCFNAVIMGEKISGRFRDVATNCEDKTGANRKHYETNQCLKRKSLREVDVEETRSLECSHI